MYKNAYDHVMTSRTSSNRENYVLDKKNYKTCEFEFNCEIDESREGNEWLKI